MLAALILSLAAAASDNSPRPRIDVAFALDTTGSMGDEIDVVKEKIVDIVRKISSGQPRPDVRFGIVAYRDRGDIYLTKTFPFSREISEVRRALQGLDANGGGDEPEAVAEGLYATVHELQWDFSPKTARMIFLIGDAGPHEYPDGKDWRKVVSEAAEKKITITAIGCSGLNPWAEGVFAQIAKRTGGELHHLKYTRVTTDDRGHKRTVLSEGARTYLADGELSQKDWKKGASALVKEGKVRVVAAPPPMAASVPVNNNLDAEIASGVSAKAKALGVAY
jgi:Mg-chelatase subunit ChlD